MSQKRNPGSETKKPAKKKQRKRSSTVKRVVGSVAIALVFTGLATTGIVYYLSMSKFNPSKLLLSATLPTVVYDRFGNVAFTIEPSGIRRVNLNQIPKYLQDGLIATEDARFYQNHGIDIRSTLRSLVNDVLHHGHLQGASTITEQLAKVVYLTDNRSLQYKLQQILLAVQIDHYFTKNQILDKYFNFVNFNGAVPGIENAAQIYFQKNVNQLNLAQCALLAGLPQAPTEYDPFLHPHAAFARRNIVLKQMVKYKYISAAAALAAEKQPLQLASSPGLIADGVPSQYASYRDFLYNEANQIGIGAQALQQGGLKIYTNLDPQLQQAAYDQFNNNRYFPPNMDGNEAEGGAVFLNPANGGLLAIMGTRPNSYLYEGFNYATQTERSPGSSIKPLVVYGPAIDSGKWNANSLLYDGPLSIGGYHPQDWEWHPTVNYHVTMRDALAMSWNIPAVWLLDQIGIGTGIDFAERAGLNFDTRDFYHLDVALGDIHPGTNPLQMADAYTAFDNNGERMPAHAIERIVNSSGNTIYQASPIAVSVMKPSTAQQMVGLLRNNVVNGIAHLAGVSGHEVAGKTGSVAYLPAGWTTSPGDSDLWFSGFTPHVVGAIWEGFPNPGLHAYVPNWAGGSALPAELFSAILSEGLSGRTGGQFAAGVSASLTPSTIPTLHGLSGSFRPDLGGVSLSWTPIADPHAYYLVFRGAAHDSNLFLNHAITNVATPSFTNLMTKVGTYSYQVVAFDSKTHAELGLSPVIQVTISQAQADLAMSLAANPAAPAPTTPSVGQSSGSTTPAGAAQGGGAGTSPSAGNNPGTAGTGNAGAGTSSSGTGQGGGVQISPQTSGQSSNSASSTG